METGWRNEDMLLGLEFLNLLFGNLMGFYFGEVS